MFPDFSIATRAKLVEEWLCREQPRSATRDPAEKAGGNSDQMNDIPQDKCRLPERRIPVSGMEEWINHGMSAG